MFRMNVLKYWCYTLLIPYTVCFKSADICSLEDLGSQEGSSYDPQEFELVDCNCSGPCIRKCCSYEYSYSYGKCLKSRDKFDLAIQVYDQTAYRYTENSKEEFSLGFMSSCKVGTLLPAKVPDETFYVQTDGKLWIPSISEMKERDKYCIENTLHNGLVAFVCLSQAQELSTEINEIGKLCKHFLSRIYFKRKVIHAKLNLRFH